MDVHEPRQFSATISTWGQRWEVLDRIEFTYIRGSRIPDDWLIYDPKSGTRYDSAAHRRADSLLPTATIIPRPFGKVMVLDRHTSFTRGDGLRTAVVARTSDGATRHRYERVGYELELLVDVQGFVLEAACRVTEDDGTAVESGFRVIVTDR
jgi:hypothetical protein